MVAVIESRPLAPSQAQLPNRDRASAGGRIRRQQLKYSNRYSPIKKVHPYHQHTPNTTVWSRTCKAFGTITNTQRTVSNHNGRYNELTPNEHIVSFKKIPTMIDSFGRSSPSTGRRWPMPANKVDGLASSAKLKLDFDENNNQFDEESNLIDTDITLVSMSYTLVPEANESMFNESYSTFAANAILTSTMIEAGTSAAEKRSKRYAFLSLASKVKE